MTRIARLAVLHSQRSHGVARRCQRTALMHPLVRQLLVCACPTHRRQLDYVLKIYRRPPYWSPT